MENSKDTARIIGSILLVAFAIFAMLSLFSHSPNDPPFGDYPQNNPVRNYCGKAGSNMSGYILLGLGITSYIPFLLLAAFGVITLIRLDIKDLWIKVLGTVLIIACIPPIIYLISNLTGFSTIKPEFAGLFGLILAVRLTKFFGIAGTCIMLSVGLIIATILITDAKVNQIFTKFSKTKESTSNKTSSTQKKSNSNNNFNILSFFKKVFTILRFGSKDLVATAIKGANIDFDVRKPLERPIGNINGESDAQMDAKPDHIVHKEFAEGIQDEMQEEAQDEIKDGYPINDGRLNLVNVKTQKSEADKRYSNYKMPTIDLLEKPDTVYKLDDREQLMERASILQVTLKQFNVDTKVVEIEQGPVITMFELELAPGVKLAKVIALSDDLAIALKASSVRVVAPLPKKSSVGIEVPNTNRRVVRLKEVIDSGEEYIKKRKVPLVLGKDVAGDPLISDMTSMPHLLIAGTTGSGKSVCLNTIILSILCFQRPDKVKLLLVDPKMVEFSPYADVPHLISPIITDMKKAAAVLEWAVTKMEERYSLLSNIGVRNIDSYNKLGEKEIRKRLNVEDGEDLEDISFHLPYIIIIVDELADLMMVAAKEVEGSVIRLSQKSRAVGIHLILATQRPSVNVVTGLIKSNMPSRISFFVASKVDSRTILDQNGAEKLLGSGDLLFLPPGTSKLIRSQGAFVSDSEVRNVVEFLKERAEPEYSPELQGWKGVLNKNNADEDELYNDAVRIVLESQRGSVSLVQRRLGIGYSRAARLIELMGEDGIVGDYKGSQAREVFLTLEEWESMQQNDKT